MDTVNNNDLKQRLPSKKNRGEKSQFTEEIQMTIKHMKNSFYLW